MIHPNKYSFVFLFVLFSSFVFAQTFELSGRVSIHNSKHDKETIEYVENVKIIAPNATETYTDYKGRFQLNIKGLNKNDVINVIAKKEGWEVANKIELDNVEIGNTSLLRIFLVKKEKLEQVQNELLAKSQAAFLTLKDTFLFDLEVNKLDGQIAMEELGKRLGQDFSSPKEAKLFLQIVAKDIEDILPVFAKELAAVNLDFASDMYRTAYEQYRNGEMENAIITIDETTLDATFENIMLLINNTEDAQKLNKIRKVRAIQLNQIKDSYALKSKCLQQVFRFEDANRVNRKMKQMEKALQRDNENILIAIEEENQTTLEEYSEEITSIPALEKESENIQLDTLVTTNEVLDTLPSTITDVMIPKGNPKATTILEINDNSMVSVSDLKNVETALVVKEKSNKWYVPDYEKEDSLIAVIDEVNLEEKTESVKVALEQPVEIISNTPPELEIESSQPITYVAPQNELLVFSDIVEPSLPQFSITKKTSLRRGPSSKTKVLKRLNVGTKVEMLEKINRYWCRVLLNGKEGYVKVLLLEEVN